ncbi:tetratricopeptide repeat protein [Clostridium sp. SHJSY1]|uniref:tetratricopeptide repeat protein n=1 Tax=Clostridium sp. SHJSY1 TaxID=2942483 RepID=UPI0028751013|nr:tetratricopeptide repeat protein [Clostridium sp. SHJSY1]MDS0524361.1 tetratricopeptide repeat protein [Clostridium sp. SHJSY1]
MMREIERENLNVEYALNNICGSIKYENYDKAIEDLDKFISKYPLVDEGYHIKYKVHFIKKKYLEAKKVIDYAIMLFPESDKLKQDKVKIDELLNEYENTLAKVEEKINNEELRNLSFEKAKSYAEEKDTQNTIKYLEEAISYEDEQVDREARYCIMNQYLKAKQYDKLIENSEVLISEKDSKNSNLMSAYYYRALSYRMLSNEKENQYYREACKIYKDVTESKPNNIDAYLLRVLCHTDLKEYSEALKLIDEILLVDRNCKAAKDLRVAIYKEMDIERKVRLLRYKNIDIKSNI